MVSKFGKQWVEKLNRLLYYRTSHSLKKLTWIVSIWKEDMIYFSTESFFSLIKVLCHVLWKDYAIHFPFSLSKCSHWLRIVFPGGWVMAMGRVWGRTPAQKMLSLHGHLWHNELCHGGSTARHPITLHIWWCHGQGDGGGGVHSSTTWTLYLEPRS